jgi:hypothetical protein
MCSTIQSYNPTNATVPIGWLYYQTNLNVVGCTSEAPGSQGIWLSVEGGYEPESSMLGTLEYADPTGMNFLAPQGELDVVVTAVGAVGQPIEGTFTATTVSAGPNFTYHDVTGSFHVCRVPDDTGP